jgi:hypothetical protein
MIITQAKYSKYMQFHNSFAFQVNSHNIILVGWYTTNAIWSVDMKREYQFGPTMLQAMI